VTPGHTGHPLLPPGGRELGTALLNGAVGDRM
jgi:hypothetical protein